MKIQIILLFALVLVCSVLAKQRVFRNGKLIDIEKASAINPKLVEYVNKKKTSWKAANQKHWKGWKLHEVQKLLGAHMYTWTDDEKRKTIPQEKLADLPTSFDAREAWPYCKSIGTVLNQGSCGSCWAFAATESITDRFCINSKGNETQPLSEQDLVTCDFQQDGCEGGDPLSAWEWVQQQGLVTAACSPYTVSTCPPKEQPCTNFQPTPPCHTSCVNGKNWTQEEHYVNSAYYVGPNVNQIAAEIVLHGPVEAAFSVYEDFIHYKSGVYQHTSGNYVGGHAVKIIGYGQEDGLDYWLVVNSWTTTWGDNGLFKIRKGVDECGIESGVVGGEPRLA